MENYVTTSIGLFWIEDGILYGQYTVREILTLEQAKEVVHKRLELQKDFGDLPGIVDGTSVKRMSKEVRRYFANEGSEGLTVAAVLVKGRLNSILINTMLILVDSGKTLTKTFTDKLEAKKWVLKEHAKIRKRISVKKSG